MKGKKNIRILLPIVVVVWGILIYKVVDAFSDDDVPLPITGKSSFVARKIQERDTFSLLPVSTDPFLGTVYRKKTTSNQGGTTKPAREEIVWPAIQVVGAVADPKGKSAIYMISVNGQQHLMKLGESVNELLLVRASGDKVVLQFKGENKEFSM